MYKISQLYRVLWDFGVGTIFVYFLPDAQGALGLFCLHMRKACVFFPGAKVILGFCCLHMQKVQFSFLCMHPETLLLANAIRCGFL